MSSWMSPRERWGGRNYPFYPLPPSVLSLWGKRLEINFDCVVQVVKGIFNLFKSVGNYVQQNIFLFFRKVVETSLRQGWSGQPTAHHTRYPFTRYRGVQRNSKWGETTGGRILKEIYYFCEI